MKRYLAHGDSLTIHIHMTGRTFECSSTNQHTAASSGPIIKQLRPRRFILPRQSFCTGENIQCLPDVPVVQHVDLDEWVTSRGKKDRKTSGTCAAVSDGRHPPCQNSLPGVNVRRIETMSAWSQAQAGTGVQATCATASKYPTDGWTDTCPPEKKTTHFFHATHRIVL